MAVHPAVLCHDEVGHFIHPMSHKRNLEVTPTYVVRSFVVCKKRIRSLKRHAKISAKIRDSEIASSSWRCNRLASDQILCQKVLKWLAIDSSKHSWSDISDIEQYGRSEYSISVRSRHIRPPPSLSLSFCVKEIVQKIAYSRWREPTNSRVKYKYRSFGNKLSFVGKISAKFLVLRRKAKNNIKTYPKTGFDTRAVHLKICGEQQSTGTCFFCQVIQLSLSIIFPPMFHTQIRIHLPSTLYFLNTDSIA